MTPEQISLAKRAIASKWWKWLPGMLVRGLYPQYSIRLSDYGEMVMDLEDFSQLSPDNSTSWTEIHDTKHGVYPGPFYPDFSDPATFGCLCFLASQVYKEPLSSESEIEGLVQTLELL